MTKDEVRRIAAERGLRTATKPDSQDVCFITRSRRSRGVPVAARAELHGGRIVDADGATGRHRGRGRAGDDRPASGAGPGRRHATAGSSPTSTSESRTVTVGGADGPARGRAGRSETWSGPTSPSHGEVQVQCSAHGRPAAASVAPTAEGDVRQCAGRPRSDGSRPGQSVVLYRELPPPTSPAPAPARSGRGRRRRRGCPGLIRPDRRPRRPRRPVARGRGGGAHPAATARSAPTPRRPPR